MQIRRPVVAGQFYPDNRADCIQMIEQCLPDRTPDDLPGQIFGGIAPHAGWVYSGATAARVFAAIRSRATPATFVIFSAVHRWGADRAAVYASGAWSTPLGEIAVDDELARAVLEQGGGLLVDEPQAHAGEHSGEVQVPFIQHLFPDARLLPIIVPPSGSAAQVGEAVARAIAASQQEVAVIGTSDLTHYGATYYGFAPVGTGEQALEWVRANDERVIKLMLQLKAEEIVAEASVHHNACGSGGVAAAVAAARTLGAQQGTLLEYTTSYHVRPHGPATDFVGYAAVVLGRD